MSLIAYDFFEALLMIPGGAQEYDRLLKISLTDTGGAQEYDRISSLPMGIKCL